MFDTNTQESVDVVTSTLEEIQQAVEDAFKADKALTAFELTVKDLPSLREESPRSSLRTIQAARAIGQHNAASNPPAIPWPYVVICEENHDGLRKIVVIVQRPGMLQSVVSGLTNRITRIARHFDVDEWFEVRLEQLDVFRVYRSDYARDVYRKIVFEQLVQALGHQHIEFHDTVTKIDPWSIYQVARRG